GVADPVRYYRAMDILALSSDTEQMPLAVLEAMSVSLPVVSTDVGDVRAMLGPDSDRYVVPLGQEDAYTAALAELLDDGAARRRLGQANRTKCLQEFSMEMMTHSYERLYRDVLNGG